MRDATGTRAYLSALWRYAGVRLVGALALMVLVALTEGIGLMLLLPFLYLVGVGGGGNGQLPGGWWAQWFQGGQMTLGMALTVFVLLVSMRALLVRRREIVITEIQQGFVDDFRIRLYKAAGRASWQFLAQTSRAQLGHVLTVDVHRIAFGTQQLLDLAVVVGLALAYVVVALLLSPAMTGLALIAGATLTLILWPQLRRSRRLGEALGEASQKVYAAVSEFLGGLKLAKSHVREEWHVQLFVAGVNQMRERTIGAVRSRETAQLQYQLVAALMLASMIFIAAEVLQVAGAKLLVLALVFARLMPLFARVQRCLQWVAHMLPAWREASGLLARCDAAAEPEAALEALPMREAVQLQSVRYAYSGARAGAGEAVRGVDLEVRFGESVALIGPSGAGKSTVADLLQGLLQPDSGCLRVDGERVRPDQLSAWRRSVAYLPQEIWLFDDSVRNNLLWARADASEDAMWEALRAASVEQVIAALPNGLDAPLGERGSRLSGGERQRIALARALLTNPCLLLMDEATNALDADNEARIARALVALHGRVTTVMIAHRLETLARCDRVFVMDSGRIVQCGDWASLRRAPCEALERLFRADRQLGWNR